MLEMKEERLWLVSECDTQAAIHEVKHSKHLHGHEEPVYCLTTIVTPSGGPNCSGTLSHLAKKLIGRGGDSIHIHHANSRHLNDTHHES